MISTTATKRQQIPARFQHAQCFLRPALMPILQRLHHMLVSSIAGAIAVAHLAAAIRAIRRLHRAVESLPVVALPWRIPVFAHELQPIRRVGHDGVHRLIRQRLQLLRHVALQNSIHYLRSPRRTRTSASATIFSEFSCNCFNQSSSSSTLITSG